MHQHIQPLLLRLFQKLPHNCKKRHNILVLAILGLDVKMMFLQPQLPNFISYPLLVITLAIHDGKDCSNLLRIYNFRTDRLLTTQVDTAPLEVLIPESLPIVNRMGEVEDEVEFVALQLLFLLHYQRFMIQSGHIDSMKLVIATLCLAWICSASLTYSKVTLTDPAAKCLDGSQGAYYLWKGDPTKVMIFFEGGGWCGDFDLASTIQNCYLRSKTDLGSSTGYDSTQTFTEGVLSDDNDNYFGNWTKVFIKYCTGSGHQGTRAQPVLYGGAQLYFRGHNVTNAQFDLLNKTLGLYTAAVSQVVLTGESAGGLAVFHWADQLASRLHPATAFRAIPDSGVFLDEIDSQNGRYSYRIWFQNLMKLSNEQITVPVTSCAAKYPQDPWKCMFAQYLHPFIKTPLFAVQSLYDSWSLYNILGLRCLNEYWVGDCTPKERALIEAYRQQTVDVLLQMTSRNQNGAWAPVCVNHCYLSNLYYSNDNYRIPSHSQYSPIRSIQYWLEAAPENPRHIDFGSWPLNAPCSGTP